MAGERSSSEPPQEDSKGLRSIFQDDDSDDINMSGERENGENGENDDNVDSFDFLSRSMTMLVLILLLLLLLLLLLMMTELMSMLIALNRGGFPIKINGYALGSQENLAEGCREVIIVINEFITDTIISITHIINTIIIVFMYSSS